MARRKPPAGEAPAAKPPEGAVDSKKIQAALDKLFELEITDEAGEEAWRTANPDVLNVQDVKDALADRAGKRAEGGGKDASAPAGGARKNRKVLVRRAVVEEGGPDDKDAEAEAAAAAATPAPAPRERKARPAGTTVHGADEAAPAGKAEAAPVAAEPEQKVPTLEAAGIKPEEVERLKKEFLATLTAEYRKQFKAEDPAMPDAVADYNAAALAKKNFDKAWADFLVEEAAERRNRLADKAEIPAGTGK